MFGILEDAFLLFIYSRVEAWTGSEGREVSVISNGYFGTIVSFVPRIILDY